MGTMIRKVLPDADEAPDPIEMQPDIIRRHCDCTVQDVCFGLACPQPSNSCGSCKIATRMHLDEIERVYAFRYERRKWYEAEPSIVGTLRDAREYVLWATSTLRGRRQQFA